MGQRQAGKRMPGSVLEQDLVSAKGDASAGVVPPEAGKTCLMDRMIEPPALSRAAGVTVPAAMSISRRPSRPRNCWGWPVKGMVAGGMLTGQVRVKVSGFTEGSTWT